MNEIHIERLKVLPQRANEIWQGGLVRMPAWITREGGGAYRPYTPLWVATRSAKVHAGELLKPEERSLAAAVEALVTFACESRFGGYRPGRIEVTDAALAEHLSGLLAGAGIEVGLVERLAAVERVLDAMVASEKGRQVRIPSPLDGAGVTVEKLRHFADAAAAFYRSAPWQHLTDVDLIRIEEPGSPRGMECAVVLGAGRSVYGLGFYCSLADYVAFRQAVGQEGRPQIGPQGLWQLSFNPIADIPPKDGDLWEDHDLPVAGLDAYPLVLNYGGRGQITRPAAAELGFLEALLWAFSETTEAEIDTGRWHKVAATHEGSIGVTLAIPDLLQPPSFQEWMKRGFSPDRRAHERTFADMDRHFREHPPASVEEMNEVASRLFSGRKIDELVTQPETPLERAQELCYQAFDTHGRRRVQLAQQALRISPDCADAYVILAEQAGSLGAERDFYRQGVVAGERALAHDVFEKEVGHFWGITATRPYMRARFGLAQTLEQMDCVEEAVEHYLELLRLNPSDNQGVRYLLMPRLLQLGRDVEAARLLKDSDERSANWAYARALLAFRLSGNSAAAKRELREAFRTNPYVPEFLLAEGPLPMPDAYSPGSSEEAVICVEELRPAFAGTPGALDWLAAEHRQRQKEIEARRKEQRRKQRQQEKKRKRK